MSRLNSPTASSAHHFGAAQKAIVVGIMSFGLGLVGVSQAIDASASTRAATFENYSRPITVTAGKAATYTVTVYVPLHSPLPTGTATISGEGITTSGAIQASTCVAESNGGTMCNATMQITWPTAGTFLATISYSGDSNYAPSSLTNSETVKSATFEYYSRPITMTIGRPEAYTVYVSVPLHTPLPTGTAYVSGDGVAASAPIQASSCVAESNGSTQCAVPLQLTWPTAGTFTAYIGYSGDNNYASSFVTDTQTVGRASTFEYYSRPITMTIGRPEAYTVYVSVPLHTPLPTGTAYVSGDGVAASAPIQASSCVAESNGSTQCAVPLQITWPTAGTFTAYIGYSGDNNYASSFVTDTQTVGRASTFENYSRPITVTAGKAATYTVTVYVPLHSPLPTGTATISGEGITTSGAIQASTCVAESNGGTMCNATMQIVWPTAGTFIASISYSGDGNYAPSSLTNSETVY